MKRAFEVAKGYQELEVEIPKRATKYSAGYDLASIKDYQIKPGQIILVETGLKVLLPKDEVLKIYPRSSLAKKGLTMPNCVGIIDSDYYQNPNNDGQIFLQIYNFSQEIVNVKKGDRLCQGIFEKFYCCDKDISDGIRSSGFGSTDSNE